MKGLSTRGAIAHINSRDARDGVEEDEGRSEVKCVFSLQKIIMAAIRRPENGGWGEILACHVRPVKVEKGQCFLFYFFKS